MDNVNCSGSESSLDDCSHHGWGISDCDHTNDVSIDCVPPFTGNCTCKSYKVILQI